MNTNASGPAHRVGVGVIVLRHGSVLLDRRKGSHGAETWALPGGHLKFRQSVETCAVRETVEETGLTIQVAKLGPYTNDVMPGEGKHYVTVFVVASWEHGTPVVREPEMCEGCFWFRWSEMPRNLFQPLQSLVAEGFAPSEA